MASNLREYDEQYYARRQSSPTLCAEIRTVTDFLQARATDRVLELGCGGGELLSRLMALGVRDIVGVDWLRTSVCMVRSREPRARLLQADACALPFSDGRFDRLVAQHLIEHFDDTGAVLGEWRRVLKMDGILVIVTPNLGFPHPEWFDDPTHRHIFSKADLYRHLDRAGYRVNSIRVVNPFIGSLALQYPAARYLQFLGRVPWLSGMGMSLVVSAARV